MKSLKLKGKLFHPFLIFENPGEVYGAPRKHTQLLWKKSIWWSQKKLFLYFLFLFNKEFTNLTSAGNIIFDEQRAGGGGNLFPCYYFLQPKNSANKTLQFFWCFAQTYLISRGKIFLKGGKIFYERNRVFATNSNFLIPIFSKIDLQFEISKI